MHISIKRLTNGFLVTWQFTGDDVPTKRYCFTVPETHAVVGNLLHSKQALVGPNKVPNYTISPA